MTRRKRPPRPPHLPPWYVRECLWRRHPKFGLQAVAPGHEDTTYGGDMVVEALTWADENPEAWEAWRARIASACTCFACTAGGQA